MVKKTDYAIQQNNAVEIDLGNILKGIYLLQVEDTNGKTENIKIVNNNVPIE